MNSTGQNSKDREGSESTESSAKKESDTPTGDQIFIYWEQ